MPAPKTPSNELPTIDLDAMPIDPGQGEAPPTDQKDEALAAMDAGVDNAPLPEAEPPEKAAEPADSMVPATVPGTPEHAAAELKTKEDAAAAEPAAATKTPEELAEETRRAEVDKEADALGIRNDKTRKRFHDLNEQVAKSAPLVAQLEKVGVKDAAGLQEMIGNAQSAIDIVGMVQKTGADPTQYVMALDYLEQANLAVKNGDLVAAGKCYDWMLDELKHFAGMLGKEVPGIVDPLAAHEDLQEELADERITRARALEIAASRAQSATTRGVQDRQAEQQQAQQQTQAAQDKAVSDGKASLNALGAELAGANPAQYQALLPALKTAIADIAASFPPEQWAAATRLAWKQLAQAAPVAAPVAQPAGGNLGPARSTGPTPPMNKVFADPMDALEAGIDAADSGN